MELTVRKTVYLDYNATTPYASPVKKIMQEAIENNWGNPSSSYNRGLKAKKIISDSRTYVAEMINAKESEIVFVSGGTEANNVAIRSAVEESKKKFETIPHVISTNLEHDATLKLVENMSDSNEITASFLATNTDGTANPDHVIHTIRDNTAVITLMLANNETGAILNLNRLSKALEKVNAKREKENLGRVYLHVDAAQAIGKIPVCVVETPVDYLTIVGHKFYGPRIGALYVKDGRPLTPLLRGGSQENGRRPGTENTVCIAGLGEAAKLVRDNLWQYHEHFASMKEYLKTCLQSNFPKGACKINFPESPDSPQLPNTLSVCFPGFHGARILDDCPELEISTGAACHSTENRYTGSRVLKDLLPEADVIGTLRISLGRETSKEDIDLAILYLREAINSKSKK